MPLLTQLLKNKIKSLVRCVHIGEKGNSIDYIVIMSKSMNTKEVGQPTVKKILQGILLMLYHPIKETEDLA